MTNHARMFEHHLTLDGMSGYDNLTGRNTPIQDGLTWRVAFEVGDAPCLVVELTNAAGDIVGSVVVERWDRSIRVHTWDQEQMGGDPATITLVNLGDPAGAV